MQVELPKWMYGEGSGFANQLEAEQEENSFAEERPPLKGESIRVPQGLYDLSWCEMKDAYGEATLTPYYIEALGSNNEGDRQFGIYGLYSATTHQGSIYEASQKAIPFLVDMLEAERMDPTIIASHFLARIAVGENHFIHSPRDVELAKGYYEDVRAYQQQLLSVYQETRCEEIQRLLSFFPGALPDYLDLTIKAAQGDSLTIDEWTYLRQASSLIAQGFIIAERSYQGEGFPEFAKMMQTDRRFTEHEQTVRELLNESPSLLVRGAAAICLSYSGLADDEVIQLLEQLVNVELTGAIWAWDFDFGEMICAAWLFAVDVDTLLENESVSPQNRLTEAALRLFTLDNTHDYVVESKDHFSLCEEVKVEQRPLLLHQLTNEQRRVAEKILEQAPDILGSYPIGEVNLPDSAIGLSRLLGYSDEILCSLVKEEPLWFILETSILMNNQPEKAVMALEAVDIWTVMKEVFVPFRKGDVSERCTLNLHCSYGDPIKEFKLSKLMSVFADALANDQMKCKELLEEWFNQTMDFEGYDWSFRTPALSIGTALLSLGRKGNLSEKYFRMVRPYHKYPQHSAIPLPILNEILSYTSDSHQKKISNEFPELAELIKNSPDLKT